MVFGKKTGLIAGLAGAALSAFLYSILVEPFLIEKVDLHLYCPRLPREFDGYRILQLSDFHTRKLGKREAIVRKMIEAMPTHDLLLITGDLIHTWNGLEPFIEYSKCFKSKDGVFAVFGNSEHKNGVRSKEFAERLGEVDIKALVNTHVTVQKDGALLYLVGVDDPASSHDNLPLALNGVPQEAFKLLMMHSPDPIGQAAALGVDVVLSGHTHGGQLHLPFIGPVHTNTLLGPAMSCGLYSGNVLYGLIGFRPGLTQLYVTRGIGISGFALRFLCRPEITSITLHCGPLPQ